MNSSTTTTSSPSVHYIYDVYQNLIEEDIDPTGGGSYTTKEQFALDVTPKLPVQVLSLSGAIDASEPADTLLEFVNGALAYRYLNAPGPSGVDVVAAQGTVDSLQNQDATTWPLVNNQGTETDIVDVNGVLIDHMVDALFGQTVYESNATVHHLQNFSGGIGDPNTGLIKFGQRWYDPLATVWISVDPAGFRAGDTDLGRYAGNSPATTNDTSGLGWLWGTNNWWDSLFGNPPLENFAPPDPSLHEWLAQTANENKTNPFIAIPCGTLVGPAWLFDGGLFAALKGTVIGGNTYIVETIETSDDPVQQAVGVLVLIEFNTIGVPCMAYSWWNSFPTPFGSWLQWGFGRVKKWVR